MAEQTVWPTKNKMKNYKRHSIQALVGLFFLLSAFVLTPFSTSAQTQAQLEQEKKAKEALLSKLNTEIKNFQGQINNSLKQANTLQNQIGLFTAQISQTETQILITSTNVAAKNEQVETLKKQIEQKEVKISEIRNQLSELLRELYQMDRSSATLMTIMNNDTLSDFFDEFTHIQNVQGRSYDLLQEIKNTKAELEKNKSEVEAQRAELQQYQDELEDQQAALDQQRDAKSDLLIKTKGEESNYRKLLSSSQQEEDKVQNEINNLEAQLRKDIGTLASPGKKGIFYWPMKGTLTQGYGNTGFTSLGYNSHNGIDLAAAAGTPIYAAYDGVVHATGTGQAAYGNWAVLKHTLPGGRQVMTLYAHMLRISVKTGQQVKGGATVVGTEGNTGNTTRLLYGPHRGFHLHFSVFDAQGFKITPGAYGSVYGSYQVPAGYAHNPMDFL